MTNTNSNGLNDTILIKMKEFVWIPCSFISSDMNFQTINMPKEIFAKFLSQKKLVPWNHSYLKCALVD